MSSFDFPEEFATTSSGSYMNFEDGNNKFRILSEPIFGQLYWKTVDDKKKPIRKKLNETVPMSELEIDKWGNPGRVNHFMAVVAYNYRESKVQVLEIDKKTINNPIKELAHSDEWGDPREYDIVVSKSGSGRETKYSVKPVPPKKLDKDIKKQYEAMDINLEVLYENGNPLKDGKEEVKKEVSKEEDLPFGK